MRLPQRLRHAFLNSLLVLLALLPGQAYAQSFSDYFTLVDSSLSEDSELASSNFIVPNTEFSPQGLVADLVGTDIGYQAGLLGATILNYGDLILSPTEYPTRVEILVLGSQFGGDSDSDENNYIGQINVNLEAGTYDGQLIPAIPFSAG